jgi:hypothetical protein
VRLAGNLLCLAATLALVIPAAAEAQRTGSRIGKDAGPRDAAAVMQMMADCIAGRRPELVRRWFQLLPGSAEEGALLRSETDDMSLCLDSDRLVMDGKALSFRQQALRLPVAQATLRLAMRSAPAESPAGADSDPWFMAQLRALPKNASMDRPYLSWLDFGHCVAVHDWADSLALLQSAPDSPAERAAVKKLVPVLGPCITQNSRLVLTPANLREGLTEPVVHLIKGWTSAGSVTATNESGGVRN